MPALPGLQARMKCDMVWEIRKAYGMSHTNLLQEDLSQTIPAKENETEVDMLGWRYIGQYTGELCRGS